MLYYVLYSARIYSTYIFIAVFVFTYETDGHQIENNDLK